MNRLPFSPPIKAYVKVKKLNCCYKQDRAVLASLPFPCPFPSLPTVATAPSEGQHLERHSVMKPGKNMEAQALRHGHQASALFLDPALLCLVLRPLWKDSQTRFSFFTSDLWMLQGITAKSIGLKAYCSWPGRCSLGSLGTSFYDRNGNSACLMGLF